MNTKEAAVILGYANSSRVRQLILAGKLPADKVRTPRGQDWSVRLDDVMRLRDSRKLRRETL
jgi:hypothetical protein